MGGEGEEDGDEGKVEEKVEVDVVMVDHLHRSHHHHHHCSYSELDMFQYSVENCGLQLPPTFVVYGLDLCVHPTFDAPLLPHPAGLAVQPAPHFAI